MCVCVWPNHTIAPSNAWPSGDGAAHPAALHDFLLQTGGRRDQHPDGLQGPSCRSPGSRSSAAPPTARAAHLHQVRTGVEDPTSEQKGSEGRRWHCRCWLGPRRPALTSHSPPASRLSWRGGPGPSCPAQGPAVRTRATVGHPDGPPPHPRSPLSCEQRPQWPRTWPPSPCPPRLPALPDAHPGSWASAPGHKRDERTRLSVAGTSRGQQPGRGCRGVRSAPTYLPQLQEGPQWVPHQAGLCEHQSLRVLQLPRELQCPRPTLPAGVHQACGNNRGGQAPEGSPQTAPRGPGPTPPSGCRRGRRAYGPQGRWAPDAQWHRR